MLTTAQIREIIQTIVNGYNPEKVYLFGSYANGTARKDSDLDICVIKETNERAIDRRVKVQSLFNP
ncbi:MAG TPA: nucleotidyltransferase domain-containing protein, partial [Chitinophagaceae bacterium]